MEKVTRQTDNRHLNMYHIDAHRKDGEPFDYYFASRNDDEHIKYVTHSTRAEGMAIYAVCQDEPGRIVLLRQYRYPIGDYVYELPAGLIEPGESAEDAAVREMKEETGLTLTVYEGGRDYYRNPGFLAQGITDESGSFVYGFVSGSISDRYQEQTERIEVLFADKDEVRRILSTERVSMRAMLMLMNFLRSDCDSPFEFLSF